MIKNFTAIICLSIAPIYTACAQEGDIQEQPAVPPADSYVPNESDARRLPPSADLERAEKLPPPPPLQEDSELPPPPPANPEDLPPPPQPREDAGETALSPDNAQANSKPSGAQEPESEGAEAQNSPSQPAQEQQNGAEEKDSESDPPQPISPENQQAQDASTAEDENPLITSLLKRNPFGNSLQSEASASEQASSAHEPPQGLELRSIYCVDGKWYFGIADTKLKTFYTIPLGAKQGDAIPYSIDFYDDETNSISITNDLGSYTLSLKERDKLTGTLPNMVPAAKAPPKPAPQPKAQVQVRRTSNTATQRSNQR